MKIGITGSLHYTDEIKIKNLLYKFQQRYKDDLIIATGGNKHGTDKIVKRICKWEFGIKYTEFPPYFERYNPDCELNEVSKYKYNQDYSPKFFFIRYIDFAKFCDNIIILSKNKKEKITKLVISASEKKNKKYILTA